MSDHPPATEPLASSNAFLVAADTGLKTFGLAVIQITPTINVIHASAYKYKEDRPANTKTDELVMAMAACARMVHSGWPGGRVCAAAVEAPSYNPKMSRSSVFKIGTGFGIFSAIAAVHGVPVFTRSPQVMKKHLTGRKDAPKERVRKCLMEKYGDDIFAGIPKGIVEHAGDAVAVGVCVAETEPAIQIALTLSL